jgi:hypothetical protein
VPLARVSENDEAGASLAPIAFGYLIVVAEIGGGVTTSQTRGMVTAMAGLAKADELVTITDEKPTMTAEALVRLHR